MKIDPPDPVWRQSDASVELHSDSGRISIKFPAGVLARGAEVCLMPPAARWLHAALGEALAKAEPLSDEGIKRGKLAIYLLPNRATVEALRVAAHAVRTHTPGPHVSNPAAYATAFEDIADTMQGAADDEAEALENSPNEHDASLVDAKEAKAAFARALGELPISDGPPAEKPVRYSCGKPHCPMCKAMNAMP